MNKQVETKDEWLMLVCWVPALFIAGALLNINAAAFSWTLNYWMGSVPNKLDTFLALLFMLMLAVKFEWSDGDKLSSWTLLPERVRALLVVLFQINVIAWLQITNPFGMLLTCGFLVFVVLVAIAAALTVIFGPEREHNEEN